MYVNNKQQKYVFFLTSLLNLARLQCRQLSLIEILSCNCKSQKWKLQLEPNRALKHQILQELSRIGQEPLASASTKI